MPRDKTSEGVSESNVTPRYETREYRVLTDGDVFEFSTCDKRLGEIPTAEATDLKLLPCDSLILRNFEPMLKLILSS
jgi:hypothetical protein